MNISTTDYNVKTTSFVRESDDWNNEITIDLGSLAGVSKDMVVISSKGMIGKVTSVTEVTARVSSVINSRESYFCITDSSY